MASLFSILIALYLGAASLAYAQSQGALNDYPGSIPFTDDRGFATDLVDADGNELWPEDVALFDDPSLLNPEESSIWRRQPIPSIPSPGLDEAGEELIFDSVEPSGISRLNFMTEKAAADGSKQFFRIHMSRQAHNILLRASLLAKMGYRVPPIQYVKSFTLKFRSNNERNEFLQKHLDSTRMTALPDRWVKNIRQVSVKSEDQAGLTEWQVTKKTDSCMCLYLQDVVVNTVNTHLYNFPAGITRGSFHKRRRTFEALLVPFAFTYIDESINLLSWHFGTTVNNRLFVDYEDRYQSEFFPTYSDAKWSARKILSLQRSDWVEIVRFGAFPRAVEKLLLEKLLSRRNDLIQIFEFKSVYKPFKVNSKVSHTTQWGSELVDGKLLRLEYPGYVQQFASGDPESPLSNSELFAFGKAKVFSNLIEHMVKQFNENILPRTDIQSKIAEEQLQIAVDQLIESVRQGQFTEVPFGTFTVPYASARLLMSRDIVSGKIMGTENPIQIAHTFGWSVEAGALMFGYGLPANVSANARANGYVTRTYSHLKPIKSISSATKEPFKNIFVPMVVSKMGSVFERVVNGDFDDISNPLVLPNDMDPKEKNRRKEQRRARENELIDFLSEFGEQFAPGESLIITDYIGALGELNLGYALDQKIGWDESLQAQIGVKAGLEKIRRFHLFRESESAIQIYDDDGNAARFEFNIGLSAIGQSILKVTAFTTAGGYAHTKFVRLNTNTERDESGELKNKSLLENLKLFGSLVMNFDKKLFFEKRKPTLLWHDFQQRGLETEVFAWRHKTLNTLDRIHIQHNESEKKYKRHSRGWRSGWNWEKFAVDTTNTAISEILDEVDFKVNTNTADDPGYTVLGRSRARKVSFEAEDVYDSKARKKKLSRYYGRVEHRWRGWTADVPRMRKILNEINHKYKLSREDRIQIFRPFDLKETTELQLYSITLNLHLYMGSFIRIASISRDELTAIFEEMGDEKRFDHSGARNRWVKARVNSFMCLRGTRRACGRIFEKKSIVESRESGDTDSEARRWTDMVHLLEDNLSWPLLVKLLKDPKTGRLDAYVEVTVEGFRKGDENVDPDSLLHTPYRANSLGGIGNKKIRGPLEFIQRNLKMTESEFFAYWILERL